MGLDELGQAGKELAIAACKCGRFDSAALVAVNDLITLLGGDPKHPQYREHVARIYIKDMLLAVQEASESPHSWRS